MFFKLLRYIQSLYSNRKMEEINKEQKAFWSGKGGEIWVSKQDSMDIMLSPLGEEAIKKLNLSSNENVLDIGCGCGSTTISIANEILNNGTISGIDISIPMIEKAKRSVDELSLSNVDFFVKDVQTEDLGENIFSSAYSRFGVMFFDDPFKAFSNILTSLKETGKLSFVCWQSPKLNPWQSLSVQAVREFIDLPSPPKRNPGPFAFQEKDYVNDILKKAGFKDIQIDDFQREIDMFYGKALEEAAEDYLSINPVITEMLKESSQEIRKSVSDSLIEAFRPFYNENKLTFPSATWIVSARK